MGKELPYSMLCSMLRCPFCCAQAGIQPRARIICRTADRGERGTARALLINQGKMIAENRRSRHGTVAHGRAVGADFLCYQSSVVQVLIHAAGFAMLSLTALMVPGCVLAI